MAVQTANERYRDAALRHAIDLRRYSSGQVKRVADLLEAADADLTRKLRKRLAVFAGKPVDFTTERYKLLLTDIKAARAEAMKQYRDMVKTDLVQLPGIEAAAEVAMIQASVPIQFDMAAVAVDQLKAIATKQPFHGKFLAEWFQTLERADQARLTQVVQIGLSQGEPVNDIVKRVVGTRANKYTDGVLSTTRRDAQAIVRTAINHVSNKAREEVWKANDDIVAARIWHATLDGRTTPVCMARDGMASSVGDKPLPEGLEQLVPANAVPPAHINCRSIMIAYLDGIGLIGQRPTVTDTRTGEQRSIDFKKEAKATGKTVNQVRDAWAEKNIGKVPAATTYQEFLGRQPASFQDEVLGPNRGLLFRQGNMKLSQFVDRQGNELTLAELADRDPTAFIKAGLDPAKF